MGINNGAIYFQMGKTALHWAAQYGEGVLLGTLLRTAAGINAQEGSGNTPLHLAALNGHLCVPHAKPILRFDCISISQITWI